MLARSQAFLELGNFSDFGTERFGEDDLQNNKGFLVFQLGKETPGTRIELDKIDSFKKAVEGEMQFDGALPKVQNRFWQQFSFPTGVVKYKWDIGGDDIAAREWVMSQTVAIASNRSLKLNEDPSDLNLNQAAGFGGGTGIYSGGVHLLKLQPLMQAADVAGVGLIDNTQFIEEQLKQIVENDPRLAQEAHNFRGTVSAMDGITGGGVAAIVSLAMASIANIQAINAASAASAANTGAAAGATANSTLNNIVQFLGGGQGLKEGFVIYNTGQVLNTVSNGLNLVNAGLALGGNQSEALGMAAAITGAAGGIAGGISSFQKFDGFTVNNQTLGQAGLGSDIFKGISGVSGGVGTIGGFVDPNFGRAAGIVSTVSGFGGAAFSFGENYTGVTDTWIKEGKWVDGAKWEAVTAAGGLISGAGGIVGIADPDSGVAKGLGLAGGALAAVGGVGSFAHGVQSGKISLSDKPFEALAQTGAAIGGVAAVGGSIAQATGNQELAEKFGYATMGAGALALVGAAGMFADAVGEYAKNSSKEKDAAGQAVASGEGNKDANSKEAAPDNRTSFEKANDAFKTVNATINAGNMVVGTAGGVKGAVEAYNQAQDVADQIEAQGRADYAAAQKEIGELENQASSEAASFARNRGPSGKPASAVEVVAASDVRQKMTTINSKANSIRAQLTEGDRARFDEYMSVIAQAEDHITRETAQGRTPDQQIVQDMLLAYQSVQRIVDREESYARQMASNSGAPGAVDMGNAGRRMSLNPKIVRAEQQFTAALADNIRRQGEQNFPRALKENFEGSSHAGSLTALSNALSQISQREVLRRFGHRDGAALWRTLEASQEAIQSIEARAAEGELQTEVYLNALQKKIDEAQKILDRKLKRPAPGARLEADRALIAKAHQNYQERYKEAQKVFHLVRVAEEKLSDRPVIASGFSEERRFAQAARAAAQMIKAYRKAEMSPADSQYERLKRAEEIYTRVKFTTGRETLEALKAHYQEKSRRYVETKMRFAEILKSQERKATN
jgi:hypothetical protein